MFSRLRHRTIRTVLPVLAACTMLFGGTYLVGGASSLLATVPPLGTTSSFAVLAGTTVTNTGTTNITGDLGVSPGSAVTGAPNVIGAIHQADAVSLQAQNDLTTAYNNLDTGQPCTNDITGVNLGGQTLVSGVYCSTSGVSLTGTVPLTLNAQGNSAAVFIFKSVSTLITGPGSSVVMSNSGSGCNVFWKVGSSATLDTTTAFQGSILALTSITLNTGATMLPGRALARNGAVTMDSNTISITGCGTPSPTATPTPAPGVTPTPTGGGGGGNGGPPPGETPEFGSLVLFGTGLAGAGSYALMYLRSRRRR